MLKVGITGGIGSGKTTICKILELMGAPVFYSDKIAKSVMQTDKVLIEQVKKAFSSNAYYEDGSLNRVYLGAVVFKDDIALKRLNDLVHPAVFRAFDLWLKKNEKAPYILKETALLFETRSYLECDYSILITSPLKLRIARVVERDYVSEEYLLSVIDKQLSDEEKSKLADYFIINDEMQLLIPQVQQLHHTFTQLAKC